MPIYNIPPEIATMMCSGRYSDLRINCGGESFTVHKVIVCSQSEYFAKACDSGFKEASEGIIDLKDEDPEAVAKMVAYFYAGDYDENGTPIGKQEAEDPIVRAQLINVQLYAIGDKYAIPRLKDLAVEKFISHSPEEWISGIIEILRAIYTTTPDSDQRLRDLVVASWLDNYEARSLNQKEHTDLLKELPEARADILEKTLLKRDEVIQKLESALQVAEATAATLTADVSTLKDQKDRLEHEKLILRSQVEMAHATGRRAWEAAIQEIGISRNCPGGCEGRRGRLVFDSKRSDYAEGKVCLKCRSGECDVER